MSSFQQLFSKYKRKTYRTERLVKFVFGSLSGSFFLFFPFVVSAQVTVSHILASAKTDAIFQLKKEQTMLLNDAPMVLPNWDDVEFRMESNGFRFDENEYAFRMTKNPKGLIEQQKRVYKSLLQVADTEAIIEYSKALESRYETIVRAKFISDLKMHREALILVLEDKKRVTENRLVLGVNNDLEDLAEVEKELQEEALIALEYHFLEKDLVQKMSHWTGNSEASVDFSNFISTEKIRTIVEELSIESVLNHPEMRRRQSRANLAVQEEIFEKKEDQQLLNYLQVRYSEDSDPDELFRDKISIGMGLRFGSKKIGSIRAQELAIEKSELRKETEIRREELENNFEELINEVIFLFEKADLLKNQIADYRRKYAPKIFLSKGITKPMVLLDAEEVLLKKELLIKKTEYDIFEKYVEILFASGKSIELPERNYLSESLEEF